MRRLLPALLALAAWAAGASGHDIPNAQVDRSIQATVRPGRLEVAYEVSLAELTLTQELRELIDGPLPGGDREGWFALYGRTVGPLDAKGLIASVDGIPIELLFRRFDLTIEGHPRYTFHLDAPLPPRGRLKLQDSNYVAAEGTSRLAIRGDDGVTVRGDGLPGDVQAIPIRPVWQLSDSEERRTKQVEVEFGAAPRPETGGATAPKPIAPVRPSRPAAGSLPGLLGRGAGLSMGWLGLIAFGLGAAHAVQPGHGKTLVAATVIGRRGGVIRGVVLAMIVTTVHVGGVLAVAAGLWLTRSSRYAEIDRVLARSAGFAIAAVGLWRLGRHWAGYGEHEDDGAPAGADDRGLIGLGIAGGLVPCWDAVLLIVLAEALGRLGLGIALLTVFSLGMATVLILVGLLVGWVRSRLSRPPAAVEPTVYSFVHLELPRLARLDWERWLGIASGLALAAIGSALLLR